MSFSTRSKFLLLQYGYQAPLIVVLFLFVKHQINFIYFIPFGLIVCFCVYKAANIRCPKCRSYITSSVLSLNRVRLLSGQLEDKRCFMCGCDLSKN
jgi:hypothetical protein